MRPNETATLEALERLHATLQERAQAARHEGIWLRHLQVSQLEAAAPARERLVARLGQELAQATTSVAALSRAQGSDGTLAGLERLAPQLGERVRSAVERARSGARELARLDAFNQALVHSAARLLQGIVSRLPAAGRSYDGAGAAAPLPSLATRSTTA